MGMEARLHQVTVTLSPQLLSDLFANHGLVYYERAVQENASKEDMWSALVQDAEAFAKELGVTVADYPDFAQDLAASFQRRAAS